MKYVNHRIRSTKQKHDVHVTLVSNSMWNCILILKIEIKNKKSILRSTNKNNFKKNTEDRKK